jgi:adenylosuccinate lyase
MGLARDTEAYPLTQRAAMKTWETGRPFRETLREEAEVAGLKIDEARLDEVFRPEWYVRNLSGMFERLAELS